MWLKGSSALLHHLRGRCQARFTIDKLTFSLGMGRHSPKKSSSTFSAEEEIVILETINKCEVSDFGRYDIKEGQLKKLLAQRSKSGGFQDFNDVLMTQDIAALVKFCRSILDGGKRIRSAKGIPSSKGIVTPAITEVSRDRIQRILGLHVWGNTISWALLEAEGQINQWELIELDNLSKINITSLLDLINDVTLAIPHADAYVMEADGYAALGKLKATLYAIHLQRQQIIAMIMSGIKMREGLMSREKNGGANFYLMQARSPAKLFNLNLGSETVSAKDLISRIISHQEVMDIPQLSPIAIDPTIVEKYYSCSVARREQMHSVLLLTLAFYNQICVKSRVEKTIKSSQ